MVETNRRRVLGPGGQRAPGDRGDLARPKPDRLLIDTHVEVWTLDPKYPFRHPERPDLKVDVAAPIENQVAQMRDYGLKYAVLINPRVLRLGQFLHPRLPPPPPEALRRPWPDRPGGSARRRPPPLLGHRARLPGHAVQPALPPRLHLAELQGTLPALARGRAARRRLQLLHPAAPDADAGRHGRAIPRREGRGGPPRQARPTPARPLARVPQDVRSEEDSRRCGSAPRSPTSCR